MFIISMVWNASDFEAIAQTNPRISKPKHINTSQINIAPNTIKIKGSIKSSLKRADICSKTYPKTLEIEVIEILDSGSGLLYMLHKGQNIQIIMKEVLINKNDILKSSIPQKKTIFILREKLCQDMTQVLYENIEFLNFDSK